MATNPVSESVAAKSDAPALPYAVFARYAILLAAIISLALALHRIASVFLLIAGAIVVAVLVHLISDPLRERAGVGNKLSIAVAVVLILGSLSGIILFFGQEIAAQTQQLLEVLPRALEEIRRRTEGVPIVEAMVSTPGDALNPGDALAWIRATAGGVFNAAVHLLAAIAAGIILALSPATYRDGFLMLFPMKGRARLRAAMNASGRTLKSWLLGQFISMILVGFLTGAGLALAGIPSWFVLGLLAGLGEFVPLVGPFVTSIPGLIVGASMGVDTFLLTLAVYVGVQQIESNIITPLVMRKMASLPMALTLFSIIAVTTLFGFYAAIVATPMTVALFVIVQMLYVEDQIGENIEVQGEKSYVEPPG